MLIFLVILIADQLSKYLTVQFLPLSHFPLYPYGGVGVFENLLGIQFSLNYATNKGAAWGFFSDYSTLLLTGRILLVTFLFYQLFKLPKTSTLKTPLIFIVAGALGNILDMFTYGHVVDMFHFVLFGYDYPIFNVADSAICVGIVLYCLQNVITSNSTCPS